MEISINLNFFYFEASLSDVEEESEEEDGSDQLDGEGLDGVPPDLLLVPVGETDGLYDRYH